MQEVAYKEKRTRRQPAATGGFFIICSHYWYGAIKDCIKLFFYYNYPFCLKPTNHKSHGGKEPQPETH